MANPILVEVTRGPRVESRHRGAFAIVDRGGALVAGAGDIETPVYPRSAVKAFQALPLVSSGAAAAAGFTDAEVALACASHGGEPDHAATAASMLAKAGLAVEDLECGAHWPTWPKAATDLAVAGAEPTALHNNCSGKHSGMLALAKHLGVPTKGYVAREHPVQRAVADAMTRLCDYDVGGADWGIDGCSLPTWAMPLEKLALGFARFCGGEFLHGAEDDAARRILSSVAAHPYMVAGTKRFCTGLMRRVPRTFVKTGAEGVFCGCVPHLGLGIALKCDDGATRASECVMAHLLERLDGFEPDERAVFADFARRPLRNRRDIVVGEVRPVPDAFAILGMIKIDQGRQDHDPGRAG